MKKGVWFLVISCLLVVLAGCSAEESDMSAEPVEIMVSAAASLRDALNDMKTTFENDHENITLIFNFGSSGKLVRQIEQGAPSDVFLSASKQDMDTLEKGQLLLDETRVDFTVNELVLITNKNESLTMDSFEDIDPSTIAHFAVGEPESVPVGRYTKEVLENIGLWEPLQDKMVLGSDVRQVLTHVETGNADLGVVYSSDAKVSDKVKVLATANAEWHGPIVYPGAVVSETKHPKEAKAFLAFLSGDEGKEVLKKYGFNRF